MKHSKSNFDRLWRDTIRPEDAYFSTDSNHLERGVLEQKLQLIFDTTSDALERITH